MAKRNRPSGSKPEVETREREPRMVEEKGTAKIMCPFCTVPHPISIGKVSMCGTMLLVKAVQVYYPKRTVNKRKIICMKCGQGHGEMVQFGEGFIHLHECTPGQKFIAEEPAYSRWAHIVYSMPKWMKSLIEPRAGAARPVKEIDPQGKETGKVLGYFFYKTGGTNAPN